jgi:SAM-dependent methyltransferase
MDKRAFRQWNEEMVRKYDPDLFHNHPNVFIRWIERRRVDTILSLLCVQSMDYVLEVGCGAGNILERIKARVLCGVDLSGVVLGKAKDRIGGSGYLQLADAEELPYRPESFDKVYCSEVLEHVLDPKRVVMEMVRILRSDGIAVISIPNENLINSLKKWARRLGLFRFFSGTDEGYRSPQAMDDEWHIHHFNLGCLRNLLVDLMVVEEIKAVPWRWLPLRYVVRCKPVD